MREREVRAFMLQSRYLLSIFYCRLTQSPISPANSAVVLKMERVDVATGCLKFKFFDLVADKRSGFKIRIVLQKMYADFKLKKNLIILKIQEIKFYFLFF